MVLTDMAFLPVRLMICDTLLKIDIVFISSNTEMDLIKTIEEEGVVCMSGLKRKINNYVRALEN